MAHHKRKGPKTHGKFWKLPVFKNVGADIQRQEKRARVHHQEVPRHRKVSPRKGRKRFGIRFASKSAHTSSWFAAWGDVKRWYATEKQRDQAWRTFHQKGGAYGFVPVERIER